MSALPRGVSGLLLGVVAAAAGSAVAARPAAAAQLAVAARPAAAAQPAVAARPAVAAQQAAALDTTNPPCSVAGASGTRIPGGCAGDLSPGTLVSAGKGLVTGNVGGAVQTVVGGAAGALATTAGTALGLAAIGTWVVGGAQGVLQATAAALGATTSPQLRSTWFSSTYWRMAAIATVLTLPFLFAAAVQALLRSDVGLLIRAGFGYLPLAMLAIAVLAPLTTLLLAASDELCRFISAAAENESAHFLARAAVYAGGLSALTGSPFLVFLIGLFTIGAAFALWIELLLREAAVYVIVLMLPLAFAALVWPARRMWAIRAVEVLAALILSKFAIVAVLSLGGAAISAGAGHGGVSGLMAGAVLIMLAAFSPWALLRLVPLAEVAAGAAGSLRGELRSAAAPAEGAVGLAKAGDEWASRAATAMKREADARMADPVEPPRAAPASGRASAQGVAGPDETTSAPSAPSARTGGDAPEAGGDPPEAGGDPPEAAGDADERPWSTRPVLELGPNFAETPVWPHPDAE